MAAQAALKGSKTKARRSPDPVFADPADALTFKYRYIILIGLITAAIMEVLDTTIINVALPQMAGNLGCTFQEIGWVSTGYILSNVIILPMTAFLAATFGRKRYLLFSIVVFTLASILCGTSHSLAELVVWRLLQGAGGAALLSTAQATVRQIFKPEEQGLVQALFLVGLIVAPTVGPTLGGYLTDNLTWNWCFFINIPIGAITFFIVSQFLFDAPRKGPRLTLGQVDWTGIGLLATGLGCLQYVLEEGNQNDWFEDALIRNLAIVSAISLITMIWWELRPENKNPVVNFRILTNRSLASSLFLFVSLGFGLYGGIFIFPQFTQNILGFSATQTGLALLPGGIATTFAVIICGRILNGPKPLVDPRVLIVLGVVIFMVSMWMLGHLTAQSGESDTQFALIIRGAGLGFLFTPINNIAYGSVPPQQAQQASGLINLTRQLGGSFGIAVIGTYITNMTVFHRAMLSQYVNSASAQTNDRLNALASNLVAHGYPPAIARSAALGELNGAVTRQAATMSYNNAFLLILLTFAVTAPAVFLLRTPKKPVTVDAH
jgi:DHA2 family multidrug resistance protein